MAYVTTSRETIERARPDHRPAGAMALVFKRLGYLALIGVAAALMLLGKADTWLVDGIALEVAKVTAPVADGLARPVEEMVDAVTAIRRVTALDEENRRLRAERDQLFQWQTVARRLEAENAALRKLLNVVADPQARYVTARIIADTSGAFARSVLVDAGDIEGIARGQTVVAGAGLVGRVVGVSPRAARVLLLTDLNSRVPVFVGAGRHRAILAGDNTGLPKLIYVLLNAEIAPGDPVVTSNEAGVFPADIPIGVVAAASAGTLAVTPFVDGDHEQFVRIVDYRPAALMDRPAGADDRSPATGDPAAKQPPAAVREHRR